MYPDLRIARFFFCLRSAIVNIFGTGREKIIVAIALPVYNIMPARHLQSFYNLRVMAIIRVYVTKNKKLSPLLFTSSESALGSMICHDTSVKFSINIKLIRDNP